MIEGLQAQLDLRERLYVHTDRSYYHSGERMWFSMFVVDADSNKIINLSKVAYVELLDSASRPVKRGLVSLNKGKGQGTMDIPTLHAGVYTLIAYTSWMKNFPATDYFQMPVAVVNGLESTMTFEPDVRDRPQEISRKINLKTPGAPFNTRSLVRIELTTSDGLNSLPAQMSMSVFKIDEPSHADKFAAMGMPNEGSLSSRSVHTGSADRHGMITNDVMYLPENNGRIVTGRITHTKSGEPAKGANIFLTVPGTPERFYNGISNDAGEFLIEMRKPEGCDSMIVRSSIGDSLYSITIHSPYQTGFEVTTANDFKSVSGDSLLLAEKSINAQVQEVYYQDATKYDTIPDSNLFSLSADYSYLLDDFTRFSKMEEVFREYVAPVAVNRRSGIFSLRVFVPGEHATYERPPLVLLDGYPIFNIDELFKFDPLKVKKIDVVSRRFFRNGIVYDGVIYLTTYTGDMNEYPVDQFAKIISDQRVLEDKTFIAPQYESAGSKESRLPDFRTLLYWSTHIQGNRVEFYTSDVEGIFMALVRGLTDKGEMVSGWTTFSVKNERP